MTLTSAALASDADSRLLLEVVDSNVTILVSLHTPLVPGIVQLSGAPNADVYIWAKRSSENPLIAASGSVSIEQTTNLWSFRFSDVAKSQDPTGGALQMNGEITGVSF